MDLDTIINVINGKVINKYTNTLIKNISIDTRTLKKGDLFIALNGKNYDGHNYIDEAIKKKASAIICEKSIDNLKIPTILVMDTYQTLLDISAYIRKLYDPYVIAVTGSVGKSTTKELIFNLLKTKYNVLKNDGNHNNHIGLPLTMFKLTKKHEILITEIGMNHSNEIDRLSRLVKPDMGVITKIGSSHIGNLGSKKNIYKAKMEITNGISDGYLLVNGDDLYLKKIKDKPNYNVIKCGLKTYNDLLPYNVCYTFNETTFYLNIDGKCEKFTFLPGKHLLTNALIAIKIALMFNIEVSIIQEVISSYKPYKQRMNIYNLNNDLTLIDDTYNASYESVKGLVDLSKLDDRKKIYIIGDILELGKKSKRIHKKIGKYINKVKNKELLLYGDETRFIKGKHFKTKKDIIDYLLSKDLKNTLILIKGSRKMQLEEIVKVFKTDV